MLEDQKDFYNKESEQYSKKRYEGPLITYVQFLFRRRLQLLLTLVEKIKIEKNIFSVFEIGCADGIILQSISRRSKDSIQTMKGIDVSPDMIKEATFKNKDPRISFAMRGEEGNERFDIVIELGVHTMSLVDEMQYIKSHLKPDGYCIYSLAAKSSLHARIKLKNEPYLKEYLYYYDAEKIFSDHFTIISSEPYGLFVPKLWAFPRLGRFLQPLFDAVFKYITPSLFHEKIYLLKNK